VGHAASKSGRNWAIGIGALACAHVIVSLSVARGFALTAFGDILQSAILLGAATFACWASLQTTSSRARIFWGLMGLGLGMWCVMQIMWTYV
jgi:hypothetical protein